MKNIIHSLTLLFAFFVWCPLVSAGPILSADGSMLTGLDVNGTLYDIEFLDGIVSEVFPIELVTAPGWYELAGSVTAALYDSLASMGMNDNEAFRGCKDSPGIPGFIGPDICIILTPDKVISGNSWGADNLVVINYTGTYYTPPPYGITGIDGSGTTGLTDFLTLARFSPVQTSIPVPGSLLLTLSGLLLIALRSKAVRSSTDKR